MTCLACDPEEAELIELSKIRKGKGLRQKREPGQGFEIVSSRMSVGGHRFEIIRSRSLAQAQEFKIIDGQLDRETLLNQFYGNHDFCRVFIARQNADQASERSPNHANLVPDCEAGMRFKLLPRQAGAQDFNLGIFQSGWTGLSTHEAQDAANHKHWYTPTVANLHKEITREQGKIDPRPATVFPLMDLAV